MAVGAADKYTVATYQVFKAAYDSANEIIANESATQQQVDAAYQALQTAFANLKK